MEKLTYIFVILVLIPLLFVACEEYYKPAMEVVPAIFVVESHLTNDLSQSFVKLSMTRNFYSTDQAKWVTGARVKLIEDEGRIMDAIEYTTGYFTFPETPVPGKKYHLQISFNGDSFESESAIMPPLPTIDSIYAQDVIKRGTRTDAYGVPATIETPGREIYVDAPINPTLQYYKFNDRAILQWVYTPPQIVGPPPPPFYGWKSIYFNNLFNLAGPKDFNVSTSVRRHPLLFLDYQASTYLDSVTQDPAGWILIINQYGITKESYDFHLRLNNQFSAVGNLFDPVQTQVYGNIHCTTNPEKLVLGYFDLNSYRQYRYYLYPGGAPDDKIILRQLNHRDFDIPDENDTTGIRPVFWEY